MSFCLLFTPLPSSVVFCLLLVSCRKLDLIVGTIPTQRGETPTIFVGFPFFSTLLARKLYVYLVLHL